MLKNNIGAIAPDVLIVAEEFGEWEGSRRRIDLLGVDKNANLVVIELKRTEDGGHMDLQAIRYSAMISTLTFDRLEQIYSDYLKNENKIDGGAKDRLIQFFEWDDEVKNDQFGQEVKIILASSEFSKELTTTVLWLNQFNGMDIRCVRMHPYTADGQTYLDIETIIPIPGAEDYQTRIKEKKQRERESRSSRDYTKYDLVIDGQAYERLTKRYLAYHLISSVLRRSAKPQDIIKFFPARASNLFEVFDGKLKEDAVKEKIMETNTGGQTPRHQRFFCDKGQLFYVDGKTYVLSNQWGKAEIDGLNKLASKYENISISVADGE
jgi:hypothetical protein